VHIVNTKDQDGQINANKVYRTAHIEIAKQTLKPQIPEKRLLDILDQYWEKTREYEGKNPPESEEPLRYMKQLSLGKLRDFSYIKDEPKTPVFIENDQNATRALQGLREALQQYRDRKTYTARAKLREAKTRLENHTINVWKREPEEPITPGSETRHLKKHQTEGMYHPETGWVVDPH
jgi:hypothetical protein